MGESDEVAVGPDPRYYMHAFTEEEINGPPEPAPVFAEPIEAVRERVSRAIRRVVVPRTKGRTHSAIEALIVADDRHREKRETSSTPYLDEAPWFDSPVGRRRL